MKPEARGEDEGTANHLMPKIDTSGFNDKASQDPAILALYEAKDYLPAYAEHTAMRMQANGPEGSIGRTDEWETLGVAQLDYLKNMGLTPSSRLLDFGCGPGRLARKAVPYLEPGHYLGVDLCPEGIEHAKGLAKSEGWDERKPMLVVAPDFFTPAFERDFQPDFIWAHSVLSHLPPEILADLFRQLGGMKFGTFLFTYKAAPKIKRSGLKQFQYPTDWLSGLAAANGMKAELLPSSCMPSQTTMKVWK